MNAVIEQTDLEYLVGNVLPAVSGDQQLTLTLRGTHRYGVSCSESLAHTIVDKLTQLFMERGLQADHEPNGEGLLIEQLIDVFNPVS